MSELRVGIGGEALAALRAHGQRDYPREACGLLLGRQLGAKLEIDESYAVKNLNQERSQDRYDLDQRGFLAADRKARTSGRDIVGIYHSHPDHPARPSEFDRTHGYPGWVYLIVQVVDGQPQDLGAFVLASDGERFDTVAWEEL